MLDVVYVGEYFVIDGMVVYLEVEVCFWFVDVGW